MDCLERDIMLVDIALQVHQTGGVGGDDIFGSGIKSILYFLFCHSSGDGFKLNRKGSSETTTDIMILHLTELQPFHVGQQPERLIFEAILPQGGTRTVVGNHMFKGGSHILLFKFVDQEVGELKNVLP